MSDGDSNGDGDESSVDDLLRKNQLSAKQELDEQKEALLNELPQGYKDKFGAIGFCKWSKKWLPVLIRGPYDVGPGDTRRQWMDAYENLKAKGRVHKLPYLVYWYGARDKSEYYSFMPSSNFVHWENEEKLKKLKIQYKHPKAIQAKLDNGESLTKTEEDNSRPLREMLEDVDKKPEDRKRGDVNFQEAWELITMDDVNDCMEHEGENDSTDDEKPKPIVEKKKGKPGRKPKNKEMPKKRKRADDVEDEEPAKQKRRSSQSKRSEIDQDDNSDPPEKRKKVRKTSKSRNAKDIVQISQDEKTLKQCKQAYLPTVKTWASLIKGKDVSQVIQHLEEYVKSQVKSYSSSFILECGLQGLAQKTMLLFDEISPTDELFESAKQFKSMFDHILETSAEHDQKDSNTKHDMERDFADDDVSSGDEKEDAFVPEPNPEKSKKRSKPSQLKPKVSKKKQDAKHKIAKQPKKNYEALVDSWKAALLSKDIDEVYQKIQEGQKAVNSFKLDDHFFSEMHRLVKDTKDLFKEESGSSSFLDDAKACLKAFKQTLKGLYIANGKATHSKKAVPRVVESASKTSEMNKGKDDESRKTTAVRDDNLKEEKGTGSSAGNGSNTDVTPQSPSRPRLSVPTQTKERKKFSLNNMLGSTAKHLSSNETKPTGANATVLPERLPDSVLNRAETKSGGSSNLPTIRRTSDQKSFSLGSIIRSQSKSSMISDHDGDVNKERETIEMRPKPKDTKKETPSWMVEVVYPPKPIDSRRQRAIDFLLDCKSMLENATLLLNFEAICLSIEAAVFDWARDSFGSAGWESHYWTKVHEVVAAISSTPKKEKALIKRIAEKEFPDAKNVLDLNLELLTEGFEKFPMVVSNN